MLGLGDIIVPGLYLSLCFKYDIDNCILGSGRQRLKFFKTPLYYSALILYIIGFCLTYLAMYLMERPQPALVFIVPCLSISLLINKCLGSNRLPLCKYNSSTMAKSQQNGQRVWLVWKWFSICLFNHSNYKSSYYYYSCFKAKSIFS